MNPAGRRERRAAARGIVDPDPGRRAEAARVDADEPDGGNDPQKRQLLK